MLFRAAHTLKGSSRAMGFLAVGDLTHEMENVLDDLRNDKLAVTTPIVNALLDCLDALAALVDTVAAIGDGHRPGGQGHPGAGRTAERAADGPAPAGGRFRSRDRQQPPTASPRTFPLADTSGPRRAAREAGLSAYQIHVTLSPTA